MLLSACLSDDVTEMQLGDPHPVGTLFEGAPFFETGKSHIVSTTLDGRNLGVSQAPCLST